MGDKIVVMKDGVIMQIGDPLTLYNFPTNRFVAGFIGSPAMNFLTMKVSEEGGAIIGDEGNFRIRFTGKLAERAKPKVGQEVVFGIRPEDMVYAKDDAAQDTFIPATVEVVEPLGAEIHLYINTGKHQVVVRIPPTISVSVGDAVRFVPDLDRAILFDLETEQALNVDIDPLKS